MNKPTKVAQPVFSLPILLSFNELAWVAIFGMALFSASLVEHLKNARKERDAKIEQAESATRQNEQLARALGGATNQVALAKQRINELEEENAKRAVELADLSSKIRRNEHLVDNLENEGRRLREDLQNANSVIKERVAILEKLRTDLERERSRSAALSQSLSTALAQTSIRKELLGLRGKMERVAIVIDRSGSMGPRWLDTVSILETWLTHLPVKECVVIAFSDECLVIPATGMKSFAADDTKARAELISGLRRLSPSGSTNTPMAMNMAVTYDPDTIILFTDGKPQTKQKTTRELRKDTLKIIADANAFRGAGKEIHVNCVGVGDYYKQPDLIAFLIELSEKTNGAFLGRYN